MNITTVANLRPGRRNTMTHFRRTRVRPVGKRRGIAAVEVVALTAMVIPSLFLLLRYGYGAMSAFLSLLGVMIGSPSM